MEAVKLIFIVVVSYFLGSLSISIFMSSKLLGGDVRNMGSGNAGATNMARVFGMSAGVLTLAGDALKAVVAMLIGWLLMQDVGLSASGMACIVGHCFPAIYGFKGGKGVSVGAAIAFAVDWRAGIVVVIAFFVVALLTKRVSPGSIAAAASLPVAAAVMGLGLPKLLLSVFGAILVIVRHKENIKRLIAGTEPEFKPGKRKKAE